jgi:hypothetical protein
MSYSNIIKRSLVENEHVPIKQDNEDVQSVIYPERNHRVNDYHRWEYAYYPYIKRLYEELCEETDVFKDIASLSKLLYNTSTGEISSYLRDMTDEEYDDYLKNRAL